MLVINLYHALKNYFVRCFFKGRVSAETKVNVLADAIDRQVIAYVDLKNLDEAVSIDLRAQMMRVKLTKVSTYLFIATLSVLACILIKIRQLGLPVDLKMIGMTVICLLCPVANSILSIRSERNVKLMNKYRELIRAGIKRYERSETFTKFEK